MKKLLIILGLVSMMMLGTSAFAGNEIGFKAGLSMANIGGDIDDADTKTGFAGGAFFKFNMPNGNFSFQPELLYMMKGAEASDVEGGVTYETKVKLNYLEIPVIVKYEFPTQGKIKPNLFLGPVLSLLMSADLELSADGASISGDIKDYLKSTDFGATFGGGVEIMVGPKGKIIFDARYTIGLTDIDDGFSTEVLEEAEPLEMKNNAFSFFLGYSMGIGQ